MSLPTTKLECDELVETINKTIKIVRNAKHRHPEWRSYYYQDYGSILNAYREGDINFDQAVKAFQQVNTEESKRSFQRVKTACQAMIHLIDSMGNPLTESDRHADDPQTQN